MSTPTLDMSGTYSFHLWSRVSARNTDCTTERETLLGNAFIFYCCVTNYHKLHVLKQYPFIILPFLWVRSPGMDWLTSLPRVLLGWNQVSVELHSHLESRLMKDFFEAFSGCWLNSLAIDLWLLLLQAGNREGASWLQGRSGSF